jgi:hypothetical protein
VKSRILTCAIAMTFFAVPASTVRLAVQEQEREGTRYRLIDLGTFGETPDHGGTALFSGTQECHRTNTALRLGRSAAAAALCSVDYPVCQGPETT